MNPFRRLMPKCGCIWRHEMKELQRKLSVTTIMVTHDQEEALSMADRIVVMNHGVIEQVGTPTEIYTSPASLFVADFIGETNKLAACIAANGKVKIGDGTLLCDTSGFTSGDDVILVFRPEDIAPHKEGSSVTGAPDVIQTPENTYDVVIEEMEFLGSFWRTRPARFGRWKS